MAKRKPKFIYSFRWVTDGKLYQTRPADGTAYTVIVYDLRAYEDACRSGLYYFGLGGEVTDNRRTLS